MSDTTFGGEGVPVPHLLGKKARFQISLRGLVALSLLVGVVMLLAFRAPHWYRYFRLQRCFEHIRTQNHEVVNERHTGGEMEYETEYDLACRDVETFREEFREEILRRISDKKESLILREHLVRLSGDGTYGITRGVALWATEALLDILISDTEPLGLRDEAATVLRYVLAKHPQELRRLLESETNGARWLHGLYAIRNWEREKCGPAEYQLKLGVATILKELGFAEDLSHRNP